MPAGSRASRANIALGAALQNEVVGRTQLLSAGWTDAMIRANLDGSRWVRMLPGVYRVVTGEAPIEAWWWAAHLYAGWHSALAAASALQAWGVHTPATPVRIAVPADAALTPPGGRLIVVRHRKPRPVRSRAQLPPAIVVEHALIDHAATLDDAIDVTALVSQACQRGFTTPGRIRRAMADRLRVRHRRVITALLTEVEDGATTALEVSGVRRILRAHGLPVGRGQVRERQFGHQVVRDRVLEPWGIVIEFDGRLGHADPRGRFRDFRRDNAVALSGRLNLRFGWVDVEVEACEAAMQVAAGLRIRGWPGTPTRCGPTCRLPRTLPLAPAPRRPRLPPPPPPTLGEPG